MNTYYQFEILEYSTNYIHLTKLLDYALKNNELELFISELKSKTFNSFSVNYDFVCENADILRTETITFTDYLFNHYIIKEDKVKENIEKILLNKIDFEIVIDKIFDELLEIDFFDLTTILRAKKFIVYYYNYITKRIKQAELSEDEDYEEFLQQYNIFDKFIFKNIEVEQYKQYLKQTYKNKKRLQIRLLDDAEFIQKYFNIDLLNLM